MKRGFIYMTWGDSAFEEAERSATSLKRHTTLPIHLFCNEDRASQVFDQVTQVELEHQLISKNRMLALTPFEQTCFLDSDTLIYDNIDYPFSLLDKHPIVMTIAPHYWLGSYFPVNRNYLNYNTGVIYFQKCELVSEVFDRWQNAPTKREQEEFSRILGDMLHSPYILPCNWNYRTFGPHIHFQGPIKIWHHRDDPPSNIEQYNADCKSGRARFAPLTFAHLENGVIKYPKPPTHM